jgi:heme/copper-type cytochrome/quinol oxidase subunit 2
MDDRAVDRSSKLRRFPPVLTYLMIVGIAGAVGFVLGGSPPEPQERTFTVLARKYGYEPAVIHVNRGDTVRLRFGSLDVVHGFYLEGYDLDVTIVPMKSTVEVRKPSRPDDFEVHEEIVFTADREGKFRFRCSKTCGFMHPFMLGEFIVGPNRLYPTSLGLALGALFAGFFAVTRRGGS